MPQVTVIPEDRRILVDGQVLVFDFPAPPDLHALQWDGAAGHMEFTDKPNAILDASAFEEEVAPYLALWQAEKARLEHEAAQAEAERNTLKNVKARAMAAVDAAISAAITAGFDYEATPPGGDAPERLHFSYDSFDQQNFADSANVVTLAMSGVQGLPASVTWNAYRHWSAENGGELVRLSLDPADFLALYTVGALAHKAARMEESGMRKAAVEGAQSIEDVQALLAGWGL